MCAARPCAAWASWAAQKRAGCRCCWALANAGLCPRRVSRWRARFRGRPARFQEASAADAQAAALPDAPGRARAARSPASMISLPSWRSSTPERGRGIPFDDDLGAQ
eukprot:9114958-Pyramimonas_sp.AAC.1